ncbi:zinc finger BED domain-containing protein RICESLEEPER 2-like [Helianthus annuus]|uniref:zinc finger BED domain-containing protein RICESLEEPER 2-like n=1 Tax=Helianthus annuus TaxID=4232 RepID=UPI000B8FFCB7|nr:zinc finger BED domain-containing protein RICESLEEPER 2-like [Helianthus annuus]
MSDCQLPYDDIEFQRSKDTSTKEKMANIDDVIVVNDEEENAHVNETTNRVEQQNNDEEDAPYTKRKRRKTSNAWVHFRTISNASGSEVPQCIHCGEKLKKLKDGTTTPLLRHINTSCPKLKAVNKGQLKLNVGFGNSTESSSLIQNWKFSNARMREVISHMIMVHELPFNFVEYELFNVLMKEANPAFNKISRASIRQDFQNIHYMVVTCHFVDSEFNLYKSILSFVDVPPSYSGVRIYDCLFKCLKDWNIETKVATLTVDNARTNDVVARKLMENLNLQKKLAIDGRLFHMRCCAHILNLLVQDGLSEIQAIIHNVRESVKHVGASPGRLHIFSELAKQLQMSKKQLILDVSTRWNATYAMLSTALEFKEVFENYADRESTYNTLPSNDDWKKVEDVCSFLSLFNEATKNISGSEYPTSNLFLSELYVIKEALDNVALDKKDCMNSMACKLKEKFDKYWGSSNLLISIGSVMDPRYKMKLIEFSFNTIYSENKAGAEIEIVRKTLDEMFTEYVETHREANVVSSGGAFAHVQTENGSGSSYSNVSSSFMSSRFGKGLKTGIAKYNQHIRSVDTVESVKSELAIYLDEGVYICEQGVSFDALGWWKANKLKFRILSKMAADILSIPITTVASESAFSAGGRVIDPHRSRLGTKIVDMLVCGADWYRHYYGVNKKNNKENDDVVYIELE